MVLPELPDFLTGHIDPFFGTDDADGTSRPTGAEGESNPYEGMEISRNAMCPCGSGQKYKHCHGAAYA